MKKVLFLFWVVSMYPMEVATFDNQVDFVHEQYGTIVAANEYQEVQIVRPRRKTPRHKEATVDVKDGVELESNTRFKIKFEKNSQRAKYLMYLKLK